MPTPETKPTRNAPRTQMTIREQMATQIMSGLAASTSTLEDYPDAISLSHMAKSAVLAVDALIRALKTY